MSSAVYFILGIIIGTSIVIIINVIRRKDAKQIAQELITQAESQKLQDLEVVLNRIKESFGAISFDALSKNSDAFLKLANETLAKQTQSGHSELESKKKLIDQTLDVMKQDLQKVEVLVTNFEKDREQKFGELASQLRLTAEQTGKLYEITGQLRNRASTARPLSRGKSWLRRG